jgi:hypothetical protein
MKTMISRVSFGASVALAVGVGLLPLWLGEGADATSTPPHAESTRLLAATQRIEPLVEGEGEPTTTSTSSPETTTVTSTVTATVTETVTETSTTTETSTKTEPTTTTETLTTTETSTKAEPTTTTVTSTETEPPTETLTTTVTSTKTEPTTTTVTSTKTEPTTTTETLTTAETSTKTEPRTTTDTTTKSADASSSTHTAAAPAKATPPTVSFTWLPANPQTGQTVSLLSTSTPGSSALSSFSWRIREKGSFATGPQARSVTFAKPGKHVVTLRVTAADGEVDAASHTISVTRGAATLIQPFPVVNVAGTYSRSGANLSMLSVQAPVGATILVSCSGAACPSHLQRTHVKAGGQSDPVIPFRTFERDLPAGTVLEVKVFEAGEIGKLTRLLVRRGKPIERSDSCIGPNGKRAVTCPS